MRIRVIIKGKEERISLKEFRKRYGDRREFFYNDKMEHSGRYSLK